MPPVPSRPLPSSARVVVAGAAVLAGALCALLAWSGLHFLPLLALAFLVVILVGSGTTALVMWAAPDDR